MAQKLASRTKSDGKKMGQCYRNDQFTRSRCIQAFPEVKSICTLAMTHLPRSLYATQISYAITYNVCNIYIFAI